MESLKFPESDGPSSWQQYFERRVFPQPGTRQRVDALDVARGLAITLMIISHTIKGLLSYEQMPDWGIMPIHAITKFSSSTFFLVFGVALAILTRDVDADRWPKKRNRLLLRGLTILLCYKILTVVQMFQTYPESTIIDALMFLHFPDFVEVLGFYGIFLLWFPLLIPAWRGLPGAGKALVVVAMAWGGHWLNLHFDFWGIGSLKAILVETEGNFTFGQFQRGALVLGGWILGDFFVSLRNYPNRDSIFSGLLLALSVIFFAYFFGRAHGNVTDFVTAIGRNYGKHPPSLVFSAFSIGGACAILSFCFYAGPWLARVLAPIVMVGRWPLFSFCFHIVVIFVGYRYLLELNQKTTYGVAWALTLLLIAVTSWLAWLLDRRKRAA